MCVVYDSSLMFKAYSLIEILHFKKYSHQNRQEHSNQIKFSRIRKT